ncbi:dihydroorotate dehydrogenase subfamily 1 [Arcanobacterium wilhelmae]|uniref:Dihydroorotate dehydrogenase n=1 Tax=Arcanobacterium wilhelmae TaxID=1803177 RepID=A0ABT9NB27_9ACTO|nr:dihydroorotate dehydrogenase [Arcanobacterium wilhelmae]MDP9800718.1 dihydroorotate dehydrogenase subfamily 1 [Arcanobacterium wilhelmae]
MCDSEIEMSAQVSAVRSLTADVFELELECEREMNALPGQFVNVSVPGFFLRRPFAVARHDGRRIAVIVAKVGTGTRALADIQVGAEVALLGPLGNGFDAAAAGERPVLVGGGTGVPPIMFLARALLDAGARPIVALGFRTGEAVFGAGELEAAGCEVRLATQDGSAGTRGLVTDVLDDGATHVYACGPDPMLRAVKTWAGERSVSASLSLEAHMGCGFGACLGCKVDTARGPKRVCVEGPVFDAGEVLIDQPEVQVRLRTNENPAPASLETAVELAGVGLKNPVIAASGTFGFGAEFAALWDINEIGSFSFKGTTLAPRAGNPTPRVADAPGGMLNAIGLANPGVEAVVAQELPRIASYFDGPVMANVAGFSLEEYAQVAAAFNRSEQVAWLEVNISCPNVHAGGATFADTPESAAAVCRAIREVTDTPIIMKLAPASPMAQVAQACEAEGAAGVSLINTFVGMRFDRRTGAPILSNGTGGVSGPGVLPMALRAVYEVSRSVNIPVVGIGGVMSADDVIEMMQAGAAAVQVGTASLLNPYACRDIARELPEAMRRYGITSLANINNR